MVQVDVFWSYGIGAGMAVAASQQLRAADERGEHDWLASRELVVTLLVLALVFAPSGAWLLWSFPSWETMHVGDRELPGWLVAAFALTNVSQGLLGYALARRAALAGRPVRALAHWLLGYLAMFFILAHGWDGSGYRRFFSATPGDLAAWGPGSVQAFLGSDVACTLYLMGLALVPALLVPMSGWLRAGARARGLSPRSHAALWGWCLLAIFGLGLGGAALASLLQPE
ncbi:MAG: hypothetical protein KC468_35380, partial [Myxococcales bacterium]|nr:hypothetical protein [Myxococcales bacterium]